MAAAAAAAVGVSTTTRRVFGIPYHEGWKDWGRDTSQYHPHASVFCYFLPASTRFKHAAKFNQFDTTTTRADFVRRHMRLLQIWSNCVSIAGSLRGSEACVASDERGQPCSDHPVSIPCIYPIWRTEPDAPDKKIYVGHLFHATYSVGLEQYARHSPPPPIMDAKTGKVRQVIVPPMKMKLLKLGMHGARLKTDPDYSIGERFRVNSDDRIKDIADVREVNDLSMMTSMNRQQRRWKPDGAAAGPSPFLVHGSAPISISTSTVSASALISPHDVTTSPVLGEDPHDTEDAWTYMTADDWYHIVKDLFGMTITYESCSGALFSVGMVEAARGAKQSPIAPTKVFSLKNQIIAMTKAKADRRFCEYSNWWDIGADRITTTAVRFPDGGKGCVRVPHGELLASKLFMRVIPEYERPKLSIKDRVVRNKMLEILDDPSLLDRDVVDLTDSERRTLDGAESLAVERLDMTFSMSDDDGSIEAFNTMAKAKLHVYRSPSNTADSGPEEKSVTDELVMRFRDRVWDSSNPAITNADRVIRDHLNKIESDNKGSMFPKDTHKFCTRFDNLDILSGFIAKMLVIIERDFAAFQCHQIILFLVFASFHVHSDASLHPHIILGGRAEGGKSYAMQILAMLLILGTCTIQSGQTTKANFVEGNSDCHRQVLLREEADSNQLGVAQTQGELRRQGKDGGAAAGGFNGAQNSAMGSGPELMRDQITRNAINFARLEKGPNGKFIKSIISFWCHQIMILATNILRRDLADNMRTRFIVNNVDPQSRLDGETMQDKMTKVKEAPSASLTWMIEMLRYLQAMTCYVYKNINATIVQPPDKSLADICTLFLLNELKRRGATGTEEARNFMRLRCVSEVLSIVDAILRLMFVAPTSKPFTWTWFVHSIKPLLIVTIQHVLLALSMVMAQYETIKVGTFLKECVAEAGGPPTEASEKRRKEAERIRLRTEREAGKRAAAVERLAKKSELAKAKALKDPNGLANMLTAGKLHDNRSMPTAASSAAAVVGSIPVPAAAAAAAAPPPPRVDQFALNGMIARPVSIMDGLDEDEFKSESKRAGPPPPRSTAVPSGYTVSDFGTEQKTIQETMTTYYTFTIEEPPMEARFTRGGPMTYGSPQVATDDARVEALVTKFLTRAGVRGSLDGYIAHIKTWLTIKAPDAGAGGDMHVLSFHPLPPSLVQTATPVAAAPRSSPFAQPLPPPGTTIGGAPVPTSTSTYGTRLCEVRLSKQFCAENAKDRDRLFDASMALLVKEWVPLQDYSILHSPEGMPYQMTVITKEAIEAERERIRKDKTLTVAQRKAKLSPVFRNAGSRDGVIDSILDDEGASEDATVARIERELQESMGGMDKSRYVKWDSCPIELLVLKRVRETLRWNAKSLAIMGWKGTVDDTFKNLVPHNLDKFWVAFSRAKMRYPPNFAGDNGLEDDGFTPKAVALTSVTASKLKASLGMKLSDAETIDLDKRTLLLRSHTEAVIRSRSVVLERHSSRSRELQWGGLPDPSDDDFGAPQMPPLARESKSPMTTTTTTTSPSALGVGASSGLGLLPEHERRPTPRTSVAAAAASRSGPWGFTREPRPRLATSIGGDDDDAPLPSPTTPPPVRPLAICAPSSSEYTELEEGKSLPPPPSTVPAVAASPVSPPRLAPRRRRGEDDDTDDCDDAEEKKLPAAAPAKKRPRLDVYAPQLFGAPTPPASPTDFGGGGVDDCFDDERTIDYVSNFGGSDDG